MENKKSYGLFTTITMIVGIVVGSGIYFRADDIFAFTNGNLPLGLLVLSLGATCIIFGSLTLSQLSRRCDDRGGLVAYFDKFISPKMAAGFGWFQLFVYVPAIIAVIAWVSAMYTFMLLGVEVTFIQQILLGILYVAILLAINVFNRILGGYVQNIATTIKLIPLFLIAFYGLFMASPITFTSVNGASFGQEFSKMTWLTALVPLVFSYDGWTLALHIGNEVKDARRNMAKALIFSPIIILLTYLIYIIGMSKILGASAILELGDRAVFEAGKLILGDRIGNIMLVIIVISVLGVLNGVILAGIRMPQALAEKGMIFDGGISNISSKYGVSVKSSLVLFGLTLFWMLAHYIISKYNIFNGRDISEISIVFSYLSYILLYLAVFRITKKDKEGFLILPLLAIFGSLVIFLGSIIASPFYISIFILICSAVMYAGYKYYSLKEKN